MKKLKGTILEPLIALMIILFALTAAFTVVLQANRQNHTSLQSKALQLASSVMERHLFEGRLLNEVIESEGMKVEVNFERYEQSGDLVICEVNVWDNRNKLLASRKRVIIYSGETELKVPESQEEIFENKKGEYENE